MRLSDHAYNQLRLFRTLLRHQPIARSELTQKIGLTGGTTTALTGALLARHLLIEERVPSPGRGRPRVALRINPEAGYVVGAYFSMAGLTLDVVNLCGETVYSRSVPFNPQAAIEEMAAKMGAAIDSFIKQSPFPKNKIIRIGVMLPGLIDSIQGIVHWVPGVTTKPFAYAAEVERKVKIPVLLDGHTNMLARAEHWFGAEDDTDNFTLINVGLSLGAASYVDGSLWHGSHGFNAELAHIKVGTDDQERCFCGAKHCLFTYASTFGLVARLSRARNEAPPALLDINEIFQRMDSYAKQALSGDEKIKAVFDQAGKYLGQVISNHINFSDPARIKLLTTDPSTITLMEPAFRRALEENVLFPFRDKASIQFELLDPGLLAKGTASIGLEYIYSH